MSVTSVFFTCAAIVIVALIYANTVVAVEDIKMRVQENIQESRERLNMEDPSVRKYWICVSSAPETTRSRNAVECANAMYSR